MILATFKKMNPMELAIINNYHDKYRLYDYYDDTTGTFYINDYMSIIDCALSKAKVINIVSEQDGVVLFTAFCDEIANTYCIIEHYVDDYSPAGGHACADRDELIKTLNKMIQNEVIRFYEEDN